MGSVRVSRNGRYFVDEQGEPFFWLGDTQWELFRAFTPEDAEAILARRKDQGFSVIQIMVTGLGDGSRPNAAGQTPWVGHDPAHPDEAYFRNMDRVVDAADKLGLILVPGVYHQVQRAVITTENARGYARWLAARYREAPNVIWTMYPEAKQEFTPVLRELAAGLREGDGGAHMITVHPDPSPTSSSFIHGEEWLDFNMNQPCLDYELIHAMVSKDYACTPPKPTVMAEGGYEGVNMGRLQTPLEIRKQAYWSYLAGGHHSYAHDDSNSSPSTWRTWIGAPGARHLGICREVLTSLPAWWELVPDQSLFAAGEGDGLALNAAGRSATGDWALLYLSSSTTVVIRPDRMDAGGPVVACWIDPTTGARTEIGTVSGTGVATFSTPAGWADALLLLQRAHAN